MTRVCRSVSVTDALPRVFLIAHFVSPMSLSQKPPYRGAHLGINFHSTPCRLKDSFKDGDWKSSFSVSAEARYVEALSEVRISDLRAKVFSVKSLTTSRCTALVTAQVRRHM